MDDKAMEIATPEPQKFFVGDIVEKKDGDAQFWGEVKAAYELAPGKWRYDVMAFQKGFRGLVHIYSTHNLQKSDKLDELKAIQQAYKMFTVEEMNKMELDDLVERMAKFLFG